MSWILRHLESIASTASSLTWWQQAGFGAACAQRCALTYGVIAERSRWARTPVVIDAVDAVWSAILAPESATLDFERHVAACADALRELDGAMGDADPRECLGVAREALLGIDEMLCVTEHTAMARALACAEHAINAVDAALWIVMGGTGTLADEARVSNHPIMQAELGRQQEEAQFLRSSTVREVAITSLRQAQEHCLGDLVDLVKAS